MDTTEYVRSLIFAHGHEECGEDSHSPAADTPNFVADREVTSRIERLNRVWGHASATTRSLSRKYRRLWDGAITELADYKGTLYVTWRDEISRVMFEGVILGAWEANGDHMHSHTLER